MTLDRMILRRHAALLLITLGLLLTLTLVGEFFQLAKHMLSGKGTAWEVLQFFACKIPGLLHLLLPMSLVVSTCMTFAMLGRDRELRALASAGVGPVRMAVPVLILSVGVVVATILVGEFLVPPALDKIEGLMREKFGRIDSTWRFFPPQHWYKGDGNRLFRISNRPTDGTKLKHVILLEMNERFEIERRTDVRKAAWQNGGWQALTDYWIRDFEGARLANARRVARGGLDWPESPEIFRDLRGRPKQKPLHELRSVIDFMDRRGQPSAEYRLELHNRFAFPLLGLFLVLLVFPWLTHPAHKRTLAGALTEAIGLIFGAYFLVGFSTALASAGRVAVEVGVWLPVVILAILCVPGWVRVFQNAARSSP